MDGECLGMDRAGIKVPHHICGTALDSAQDEPAP